MELPWSGWNPPLRSRLRSASGQHKCRAPGGSPGGAARLDFFLQEERDFVGEIVVDHLEISV